MLFKKAIFVFIVLMPFLALAYYNPGTPQGFVNDYGLVLNATQKQTLESKLRAFEQETSNEIVVAILPSLRGDDIGNFAVKLFENWTIGKKGKDNGILLLISMEERQARIEVGYGLEGALTDAQSFWILGNVLAPAFSDDNYYEGIDEALDKIIGATKGEYIPTGSDDRASIRGVSWGFIIFFCLWFFSLFSRKLAVTRSWWLGGVIGAMAAVFVGILTGLTAGGIALAILIPLGLFYDFSLSRSTQKAFQKGYHPWWWRGPHGGSGFGGGGFGGFGGGRSGGGGASGGW
ncbi:MAG: TPM domain-containing protein [bacterium]|nr:TPM domain-containing protein [bacterium]